jgi:type II secretory pathway pseudopilin PulG
MFARTARASISRRKRRRQAGYNLVVLMVGFTVMTILLAKAMPQWSTRIQRQKEAEMMFRGMQYAEAIRIFKQRFNRAPVRLKELIEVEPRCIRQLWNNPMSQEAAGKQPAAIGWQPVFEGQPDVPEGQQPGGAGGDGPGEDDDTGTSSTFPGTPGKEEIKVGPILGVRSKEGGDSFRAFYDSESYGDWKFTADLFQPRALASLPATPVPPNAFELGRPWREGINPPSAQRPRQQPGRNVGGNVGGGQPGGGKPSGGQPGGGQTGGSKPGSPTAPTQGGRN